MRRPDAKKKGWTERMRALLSTRADKALARAFHKSKPTVTRERQRLGIPSWTEKCNCRWIEESLSLLGNRCRGRTAFRDAGIDSPGKAQGIRTFHQREKSRKKRKEKTG